MAASDEWEEVHLTPDGWVDGSSLHDFGRRTDRPTPANAVLTIRKRVVLSGGPSDFKTKFTETPLTDDAARIGELKQLYGEPTFGV